MKKIDDTTKLLGFKFTITPALQLLKNFIYQVESGKKLQIVFTPNPEQLVYAKSHSAFAEVLGKADVLLPDGVGIVIGTQILSLFGKSKPIFERVAGVDVVSGLLKHFSKTQSRSSEPTILIVGGREYAGLQVFDFTVVSAVKKIRAGKQQNIYWHEGFLNVSQPTNAEKKALGAYIKNLKPELVFVALGAPHQEEWVIENKVLLEESGVRLVMVVGGAFDMLLGKVNRAPKWLQRIGLEWLFRLSQEPWRWRRQLNLLVFLKMIVQEALS